MPVKKTTKKKVTKKIRTKLPAKLVKYLDKAGISHEILEHRTVYTAMDTAATMKKKINEIAKALYVKADKDYYVVILPADYNLDFSKLSKCLSARADKPYKVIKIPGEKIMLKALKIKKGAVSAFGNMHKLPVAMDKGLTKVKKAVFSSGSFNHSVEMAVKDFIKLEEVIVGSFGKKKTVKKQKVVKPKRKVKAKKTVTKKK
ncbi:YbaK/EbsC family protein [Candidatus Parcubacteria bacterium]|nr:YbaK/EbsC family protein [Candidatus Parcubacteria bacterium]